MFPCPPLILILIHAAILARMVASNCRCYPAYRGAQSVRLLEVGFDPAPRDLFDQFGGYVP